MKSILDPTFVYVPSVATDIRSTFERARKEIEREKVRANSVLENKTKTSAPANALRLLRGLA